MQIPDPEEGADGLSLNLTPMIDVVFLLLIFFMVATSFLEPEKELGVELPQADSGAVQDLEDDELVITVFRDGRIALEGETLERIQLIERLRGAAERNPTTSVTIRGDREARHESIVTVMDACGLAGITNLAVGTLEGG